MLSKEQIAEIRLVIDNAIDLSGRIFPGALKDLLDAAEALADLQNETDHDRQQRKGWVNDGQ